MNRQVCGFKKEVSMEPSSDVFAREVSQWETAIDGGRDGASELA
jgi:hypothetical protein